MIRRHLILALSVACLLAAGRGWSAGLERLTANSPFAPVAGAAAEAAAEAQPLEFRGVFMDQGELFFSIFNPTGKATVWVGLNEAGHDFLVRSYDADKQTLVAEFKGRTLALGLRKAPIVAVAPDPTAPTLPAIPGAPPPGNSISAAPTTEEAKRLASLAAEIRRRRAMRQQVAPPPATAAPPPNRKP